MDVLSEVLKLITVKRALFYNAEYSAPWGFRSPASHTFAPQVAAGARHVIIYHLVAEGSAWAQLETSPRSELVPGDIVIFPHGDPHVMGNGPDVEPVEQGQEIGRIISQSLQVVRAGGGGELTRLVCGYMACDPEISRLLRAGLPPLVRINVRTDAWGVWLENSIHFAAAHAASAAAGCEAVLARLSEALIAESVRRYVAVLPPGETGWLAGARDANVGKALALLHGDPRRAWTVADLAASVGISRAVLAQRFHSLLGEPPMGYLTRWRLQLGAHLLATSTSTVAQIAAQVGYDSEAAFNRAFKRTFGVPPARFRRDSHSRTAASEAAVTAG